MPSNETDTPRDPALARAEAARDAVTQVLEAYFERLVVASSAARTELDADLRAAGRLMARNTHRQLAANLTLVRQMLEARSVPTLVQLQQDFLRRQAAWAMQDLERMRAQALDLLQEGRRAIRGAPEQETLAVAPPETVSPPDEPVSDPPGPGAP